MTHRPWLAIKAMVLSGSLACVDLGSGSGSGSDPNICPTEGSGEIDIRITGLPPGVEASLLVEGPGGSRLITASATLHEPAGSYTLTASRVPDLDPTVPTLFVHHLSSPGLCVFDGATEVVELAYAPIVSSHRLWLHNSDGTGDLLGFAGSALAATAEVEPSVTLLPGASKDLAFDRDGNLWSLSSTPTRPHLLHFPSTELEASSEQRPDLGIDLEGVACLPAYRAFAFGPNGVLWVSTCRGVVGLTPNQLEGPSGVFTPELSINGLDDNGDLAFDGAQNLWITAGDQVLRVDGPRLASTVSGPPDAALSIRDADARVVVPSSLAFDIGGNLWVLDAGSKRLSKVTGSNLEAAGTRSVVATVSIALGMSTPLARPAFDESGGLWLALGQDRIGRLAPEQLNVSTGSGQLATPATIITSAGMGEPNRIAFFPAAPGLPLYHRRAVP